MIHRSYLLVSVCGLLLFLAACGTQHRAASVAPAARPPQAAKPVATKEAALPAMRDESKVAEKDNAAFAQKALQIKYASKLDTDAAQLNNLLLLAFMEEWYGVPYKYGGRDKSGIDCSAFTCAFYNDVLQCRIAGTSSTLHQQCKAVKRQDLQQGDLVFFRIYRNRISHVGVYLMNGYFIHASTRAGVVISHFDEPYYKKYYAGAGRPGM